MRRKGLGIIKIQSKRLQDWGYLNFKLENRDITSHCYFYLRLNMARLGNEISIITARKIDDCRFSVFFYILRPRDYLMDITSFILFKDLTVLLV